MTAVAFLLAALVLSMAGCAVLLVRHRQPTSLEHGVDSFRRQMRALAPEPGRPPPGRRSEEPPAGEQPDPLGDAGRGR